MKTKTIIVALLSLSLVLFATSCAKSKTENSATATTNVASAGSSSEASATDTSTTAPRRPRLPDPSMDEAKALIESSPTFGTYQFSKDAVSIPLQKSLLTDANREATEDLVKAGWLRFHRDEILLTPKAKKDKRFLVRDNGFVDVVPLAKKELVSVDAIGHDQEGSPTVEFTWHWIPNDIAKAFHGKLATRFSSTYHARATLLEMNGKWDILTINPIDEAPKENSQPSQ